MIQINDTVLAVDDIWVHLDGSDQPVKMANAGDELIVKEMAPGLPWPMYVAKKGEDRAFGVFPVEVYKLNG